MTTKKPTNKKPASKKTPTKPKAKKPAAKKVVEKEPSSETVRIQIATHEAGHSHTPTPVTNAGIVVPKKKKSLLKRIFGFGS